MTDDRINIADAIVYIDSEGKEWVRAAELERVKEEREKWKARAELAGDVLKGMFA